MPKPIDRGTRYELELNTYERKLLPEDMQQIYTWDENQQKWVMLPEYREQFSKEAVL
jgi:hypothetical protein